MAVELVKRFATEMEGEYLGDGVGGGCRCHMYIWLFNIE